MTQNLFVARMAVIIRLSKENARLLGQAFLLEEFLRRANPEERNSVKQWLEYLGETAPIGGTDGSHKHIHSNQGLTDTKT